MRCEPWVGGVVWRRLVGCSFMWRVVGAANPGLVSGVVGVVFRGLVLFYMFLSLVGVMVAS